MVSCLLLSKTDIDILFLGTGFDFPRRFRGHGIVVFGTAERSLSRCVTLDATIILVVTTTKQLARKPRVGI